MNYELIIKLCQEAENLHGMINRLEAAIDKAPEVVPLEHQVLWAKQRDTMKEYLNIPKQRIKMLAD